MLKKAYAASAFNDAAASSAELDEGSSAGGRQGYREDVPDNVDKVLEELGIALYEDDVCRIRDDERCRYHVGGSERDVGKGPAGRLQK
jgi:hypothetical protein